MEHSRILGSSPGSSLPLSRCHSPDLLRPGPRQAAAVRASPDKPVLTAPAAPWNGPALPKGCWPLSAGQTRCKQREPPGRQPGVSVPPWPCLPAVSPQDQQEPVTSPVGKHRTRAGFPERLQRCQGKRAGAPTVQAARRQVGDQHLF